MLRKIVVACAGLAVAAPVLADSTNAIAPLWDNTGREGNIFQAFNSTVVLGSGSPVKVRVWAPSMLDSTGPLQNNACVGILGGKLAAVTSTSSSTSANRALIGCGTANVLDSLGHYTSNNILVYEPGNWSDTMGNLLSNGTAVYRANFSTAGGQNNFEIVTYTPGTQTPIPEPDHGTKLMVGNGIDNAVNTSTFLGVPVAIEDGNGGFFLGNTNFDGGTGQINPNVNIWDYTGTTLNINNPNNDCVVQYTPADCEAYANAHGVPVTPAGDGRASEPQMQSVNGYMYVVFGYNDTSTGGSQRPLMMNIDMVRDNNGVISNNGISDAVTIYPPITSPISTFVDHQATGAGSDPFFNKRFDINHSGQIAVVTETQEPNIPLRYYQLLRYDPTFDGNGRINGYAAPVKIADAAPAGDPRDTIAEGMIAGLSVTAISGVSIDDQGNIGFNANYATGGLDPIDSALYYYENATSTLHQILIEKQVINSTATSSKLTLGLLPSNSSDMFFAPSMHKSAHVIAENFGSFTADPNNPDPNKDPFGGSRGTLTIAIGHTGDVNYDGVTDLGDLAQLLSAYGANFGTPNYLPAADINLDGVVDLADLATLLSNYGKHW